MFRRLRSDHDGGLRRATPNASRGNEREAALTLLAVVLLTSPATALWNNPARGWWIPYLLWLVLIAGAAWLARLRRRGY